MKDLALVSKVLLITAVAAICITLGFMGADAWSQEAAKGKYVPTEIQSLKLKVAQQDAIIAQKDVQAAQARLNYTITTLGNEANAVKKENGWPDDVNFSPDTLSFAAPAPAKASAPPAAAAH